MIERCLIWLIMFTVPAVLMGSYRLGGASIRVGRISSTSYMFHAHVSYE